ncbi:MAG TPA: hypothetical protein VFX22_01200, partial [Candidatus Kapabacteria bacterium]|nr:hypothetical protein [Candidatus Kapabacteria bacterium]
MSFAGNIAGCNDDVPATVFTYDGLADGFECPPVAILVTKPKPRRMWYSGSRDREHEYGHNARNVERVNHRKR